MVQHELQAIGLLDAEVAASVAERYTVMLMDGREGDAKAFLADFVSDAHYHDIIVSNARSAHTRSAADIREMVDGLPAMMTASRAVAEGAAAAPAVEEPAREVVVLPNGAKVNASRVKAAARPAALDVAPSAPQTFDHFLADMCRDKDGKRNPAKEAFLTDAVKKSFWGGILDASTSGRLSARAIAAE